MRAAFLLIGTVIFTGCGSSSSSTSSTLPPVVALGSTNTSTITTTVPTTSTSTSTGTTTTYPSISTGTSGTVADNYEDFINSLSNEDITKLYAYLSEQAKTWWGEENYLESGKHRYVKYLDMYQTRAFIDFENGQIYITTINQREPLARLKESIAQILLMPIEKNTAEALTQTFTDKNIELTGKPFFLGQVLDHDNQPIEWEWRANRFADYLIANKLQHTDINGFPAYYVRIDMVSNHLEQRQYQYSEIVQAAAKRYGLLEDLIYSVIKTESSFNPYAISHAGAYGLMQIVPATAGADVFNLVKGQPGVIPTKEYLFDPSNNIDTGAAYLNILKTRYLKAIEHPTSLYFSMISAYNSGSGGVLATYHSDRDQAAAMINKQTPTEVYTTLTTLHPKEEARNYLVKVLSFQKDFNEGNL